MFTSFSLDRSKIGTQNAQAGAVVGHLQSFICSEGHDSGDSVRFYGEYVWNEKGGVIHWTHHDPRGRHVTGWLVHKGKTYK